MVDLKDWEHCFAISAIGVERVLMVINGHQTVMECSHIKPLHAMIMNDAKENYHTATVLTEGIRAVHRIVADAGRYQDLSKHRKQKIRDYYVGIITSSQQLRIEAALSNYKKYLLKNAILQPYYPELLTSLDLAASEIMAADDRLHADKSRKLGGVAQK